MQWDITYLRNDKPTRFFDDSDIYHPVFRVEGNSEEEVLTQVKEYISNLMMTNCFSLEEGPDSLRVFDPTDGETVELFTEIRAQRLYSLIGCDGKPYHSIILGTLGGHRNNQRFPSTLKSVSRAQITGGH